MEKVTVPEGQSGEWKIERFTISEEESRFSMFRYGSRAPRPGTYTRLVHDRITVMSDTDAEQYDHYQAIRNAKGHVLINGLGIGFVLYHCLKKEQVTKATIIEISEDVIKLVGPHYSNMFGNRLEIIHADAFDYKPPKNIKYGMVWHDIWNFICVDNYEEMKKLHRKYGRKTEWQGSWAREIIKAKMKLQKRLNLKLLKALRKKRANSAKKN